MRVVGLRRLGIILLACTVTGLLAVTAVLINADMRTSREQAALAPFYTAPDPIVDDPGTLLRSEPLGVPVTGGEGFRVLYVSERPDGTRAVSGGMVFLPDRPATPEGRPVVAWAHGTVGMAEQCAPSRSPDPTGQMQGWLEQMLALGWVVTATDYVGLGTPGPELFLVGAAEARDVVNSVRAATHLAGSDIGSTWAVFGHSQGGHSALWTGHLAGDLAPDLTLVGVVAAAPAANLADIVSVQWDTAAGWAIGPEVVVAWPAVDPALDADAVMSPSGRDNAERLADECVVPAALEGLLRERAGEQFFALNPLDVPAWRAFADAETPPPLPAAMPLLLAQGTADEVVLAWPNAALQETWCAAGSTLSALWLGGVNHQTAATVAGPSAVAWIADRFAGRPAPQTCDTPPAVSPVEP